MVHQKVFPVSTCNDGTASPTLTFWTRIPEGEDSGGVGTYLVPQVACQYHALTGGQDKFAPVDVAAEPSINVWSLVDLQTVSLLCVLCTLGCGGAFAQESQGWAQAHSLGAVPTGDQRLALVKVAGSNLLVFGDNQT